MRAKAKVITLISARSRSPTTAVVSMLSSSLRASVVCHACVLVADGGGKEFQEATRRLVARVGDDAWHHDAVASGDGQGPGWRYGDLLAHAL
jgi:hypothetical protein